MFPEQGQERMPQEQKRNNDFGLPTDAEAKALLNQEPQETDLEERRDWLSIRFPKMMEEKRQEGPDALRRYLMDLAKTKMNAAALKRAFYYDQSLLIGAAEHKESIGDLYDPMIYMETHEPSSVEPVEDALTQSARKVLAFALASKPVIGWGGFHECSCGAHSTSTDYAVGGKMVHSLLVHYLRRHRDECSPQLLQWVDDVAKSLGSHPDPDEFQIRWAELRHQKTYSDPQKEQVRKQTAGILQGY